MNIVKSGLILKTEHYQDCRAFYRDRLGLSIVFEEDHQEWNICCFEIGHGYLMVETGGVAAPPKKTFAQSPVKIRLNVTDLEETVQELQQRGLELSIVQHDWGDVAELTDPDGNIVAFRRHAPIYGSAGQSKNAAE